MFRKKKGNELLKMAREGIEPAKTIVARARLDGATDDDIVFYWNLSDREKEMVIQKQDVFLFAAFKSHSEAGNDTDTTARIVRKMFPYYGRTDIKEMEKESLKVIRKLGLSEKSRILPHELRKRVDEHRVRVGAQVITAEIEAGEFESYNAYVRAKIAAGEI